MSSVSIGELTILLVRHNSQLALFHHPVDGIQRPVDSLYHSCNVEKPCSALRNVTACVIRGRLHNKIPIQVFNCISICLCKVIMSSARRFEVASRKRPCPPYVVMHTIPSHVSEIEYSIPSHAEDRWATCSHVSVGLYVEPTIYSDEGFFDFPFKREINAYVVSINDHAARVYRIQIAMLTPGHTEDALHGNSNQ